jgi:hypothetical protein
MGLVMVKHRSKPNTKFYIIIGILFLFTIAFAYLYVKVYPALVSAQNRYVSLNNSYYLLKNNYSLLNHTYQAAIPKINNYTNLLSKYGILNSSYLQLKSNLASPYIKSLYNGSFTVPGYSTNFVFYNSTYGLYNNYTLAGIYNLTFNLPYFGYLIISLNNFSAPSDYEGFCVYPNSTEKYMSPFHLTINPFSSEPTRAVTSDCYAPDLNYSESFIVPVPYGNTTISFEDLSEFPATYSISIIYVGIRYSNMTSISFNYSR